MSPHLMKAIIEKNLWVQKARNVQGSVRIHFPSESVADLVLSGWEPVNVFGRIGMTNEQIKLSNLEQLINAGDIQVVLNK
jgi:hypothetical protein